MQVLSLTTCPVWGGFGALRNLGDRVRCPDTLLPAGRVLDKFRIAADGIVVPWTTPVSSRVRGVPLSPKTAEGFRVAARRFLEDVEKARSSLSDAKGSRSWSVSSALNNVFVKGGKILHFQDASNDRVVFGLGLLESAMIYWSAGKGGLTGEIRTTVTSRTSPKDDAIREMLDVYESLYLEYDPSWIPWMFGDVRIRRGGDESVWLAGEIGSRSGIETRMQRGTSLDGGISLSPTSSNGLGSANFSLGGEDDWRPFEVGWKNGRLYQVRYEGPSRDALTEPEFAALRDAFP